MDKIIGFIGCGNMAQAMIKNIVDFNVVPPQNVIGSDIIPALRNQVQEKHNIKVTSDSKEVAKKADYLILAVKPNIYNIVLKEIKDYVKEGGIVIGIAAGITLDFLKSHLREDTKVVRSMPNTPAMVGEGMTAISIIDDFSEAELKDILDIFNSFGRTEIVEEYLMDGITGLSGSSPAYIFMLIEAMADGGVLEGIPRDQAYIMAAQTVLGSAKMVLDTKIHPGQLKDNVCSPGGTTIEGVANLERNGFRSTIIETIRVGANKSKEMGR